MTERDQLHQLERDVSERVGRALGAFRERLGGLLRETHEAVLERLDSIEPELPEPFLDDHALQALGGDAEGRGRCTGFEELAGTLRSIDKAGSQAAVLTALLDGSMAFANRAAFFLIRGGQVHGWGLRTATEELHALSSVQFDASGSWTTVAEGGGASWLSESEREDIATHLDGLTAEDAILIPFVLRDALAGVLYADGVGDAAAALQILTYVSAQAVEILPLRKRSETPTLTLAGPEALEAVIQEPEDEAAEAEEAVEPEVAAADEADEAEEAAPEMVDEPLEDEDEPDVELEEELSVEADAPTLDYVEADEEPGEEATPIYDEPEIETSEPIAFEETTAEIVTDRYEDDAPIVDEPEPAAIEDVQGGGWTLEDSAAAEEVDVMAAETAPVATQPAEEVEEASEETPEAEELEAPAEDATWAEPEAEVSESQVPALEVEDSPELDATGPEDASLESQAAPMPTGEETVLIRTPVMTSEPALEVEPPAPEPEPEPTPDTQVAPPEPEEATPSTQVAPPPDVAPAVDSPLVTPPSDLEGPGRAFATTRVPIDAEQVQAHEEARRLARLLVSEIKLYNEEEVEEGRRTGDVYSRLREDIDRSRQMFEERIDPEVKDSTDYFYQELVRILGGGDADALGM